MRRRVVIAACLVIGVGLTAAPAAAQAPPQQIDPAVPTNISVDDDTDFHAFLTQVMDDIMATNSGAILAVGNNLWRGLAAMVVVWTGIKIAMSGSFSMWACIELITGLAIPWTMLVFYAAPIPGVGLSFPAMIAGGGNWLMDFFVSDIRTAMAFELSRMADQHTTAVYDAWAGTSYIDLVYRGAAAILTLVVGAGVSLVVFLCLVVLYAVTYAHVIWAQVAIYILTFLGPIMIPWLVFEPMAFLFWGWFRSMVTFALYGAVAGAIMRVFVSVGLGYATTFSANAQLDQPSQMIGWLLIIVPLMVAGVLASLKVGELAGMLVSGGGGGGAGMTGALMTAASGGKAALAGKAVGK